MPADFLAHHLPSRHTAAVKNLTPSDWPCYPAFSSGQLSREHPIGF